MDPPSDPLVVDAEETASDKRSLVRAHSFGRMTSSRPPAPLSVPEGPLHCNCTLEEVRENATDLASRDGIDKDSALSIMKVFHDMECLLKTECVRRDRKIAEAEFGLEKLQLELDMMQSAMSRPVTPPVEVPPAPNKKSKRSSWG